MTQLTLPGFEDEEMVSLVEPKPENALTGILIDIFGVNCWDDSADDTAKRVLAMWKSFTPARELPFNFTTFPATSNQLIVVKDIEFSSLCAHHLLPVFGNAHIGYVPNKLMVGLSKIPRLVDFWATRPTTQETMTDKIGSDLKKRLEAHGVAVVVEARHTCMSCRGVRKHNGAMVTSNMRGVFLTSGEARSEFLAMIARDRL